MDCHFSKGRMDRDSGCPAGPATVDIEAYFEGLVGTFSTLKEQYMFQLAP